MRKILTVDVMQCDDPILTCAWKLAVKPA